MKEGKGSKDWARMVRTVDGKGGEEGSRKGRARLGAERYGMKERPRYRGAGKESGRQGRKGQGTAELRREA